MLTVDKVLKLSKITSTQTVAKDIAAIFPKENIMIKKRHVCLNDEMLCHN